MRERGNVTVLALIVLVVGLILFFTIPFGGTLGLYKKALVSFMLRNPPRFMSLEVSINGEPRMVMAGEAIKIKGDEVITLTRVNANTFFESYLGADVEGFGNPNDLGNPLYVAEIRQQIIDLGVKSIPVNIYYIDHKIASLPLEFEITEQYFMKRLDATTDPEERITLLKTAQKTFPDNSFFLGELDRLFLDRKDYNGLIALYKERLEIKPDDLTTLARLSKYYLETGLFNDALSISRKIVDLEKATAITYRNMATAAKGLGDKKNQIIYLEEGLNLFPGDQSLTLDLGRAYEDTGKKEKALQLYKSTATTTDKKEILVSLVEDQLKRSDWKGASATLKRYVKIYPNDKNAYAQLAMCMGKLGNTDEQITYYKKGVSLSPKDPVLLYNLAVSYEKAGRTKEALTTYRSLLRVKPKDKECLRRIAALCLAQKQYIDAYKYYGQLALLTGDKEDLKGIVASAMGLGDTYKIISSSKRYLEKDKDPDVALGLAYAYESRAYKKIGKDRIDDLKLALEAYRLALSINPKSEIAKKKIPEVNIEIIKAQKS